MHEASIPADATHLKRGTDAPNDEDGRDLRLSAADRSATEFYAAMIAPFGARPSVTKRPNNLLAISPLMAWRESPAPKESEISPGGNPLRESVRGAFGIIRFRPNDTYSA